MSLPNELFANLYFLALTRSDGIARGVLRGNARTTSMQLPDEGFRLPSGKHFSYFPITYPFSPDCDEAEAKKLAMYILEKDSSLSKQDHSYLLSEITKRILLRAERMRQEVDQLPATMLSFIIFDESGRIIAEFPYNQQTAAESFVREIIHTTRQSHGISRICTANRKVISEPVYYPETAINHAEYVDQIPPPLVNYDPSLSLQYNEDVWRVHGA